MAAICPNCKAAGTLRVYKGTPVYVGCEAPGCFWNQAPSAETVIDAAVATWHRENPTKPEEIAAAMERVYYSIGLAEGFPYGPRWVIWRHSFSGKSIADPRSWKFAEREAAQNALAEFASKAAEAHGMVA